MKRQPLLADRFIGNSHSVVSRKTVDGVRLRLRDARKFVFDDNAIRHTGNVIRNIPDLLFKESRFARAPFDVTYVEIPNFPLLWESITGDTADDTCDNALGFLIDHDNVYVLFGNSSGWTTLSPISYMLKTPWADDQRKHFAKNCGMSLLELDGWCWGSSTKQYFDGISQYATQTDGPQATLRNAHSCRLLPLHSNIKTTSLKPLFSGSAGEFRTLIAILLLLNRPSLTTYISEMPHYRGFVKNKIRPYFAHTVVTINLDPKPTLRMLGTFEGDAISRRRHEVRGTWCRNYDAREYQKIGCVHVWNADPDYATFDDPTDPDHWVCSVCEGKMWWRVDSVRGDAAKGFVVKNYNVKTRTDEVRRRLL